MNQFGQRVCRPSAQRPQYQPLRRALYAQVIARFEAEPF